MTRIASSTLALLLWGLAGMGEAQAQADPPVRDIQLSFRVFAGGVHALDATYRAHLGADKFSLIAWSRTAGVLDSLFKWRSKTRASGRVIEGALVPREFRHQGESRQGRREVSLHYAVGRPVMATIKGTGKYDDDSKGPLALAGSPSDVLTALTRVLLNPAASKNPCGQPFEVFTGKRRNGLRFKYLGTDRLKRSRYAAFSGPAVKCRMLYDRRVAFVEDLDKPRDEKREAEKQKNAPKVIFWLAPRGQHSIAVPVRIETKSRYGTAIVHLTELRVDNELKLASKEARK